MATISRKGDSVINVNLIPKVVIQKLMASAIATLPMMSFKNGIASFEGDSTAGMIVVKNDFKSSSVKQITMGLLLIDDSEGVQADNELVGKEEQLVTKTFVLNVEQLRHAHKNQGKSADQASPIKIMAQAMIGNIRWFTKRIQKEMMYQLSGVLPSTKTAFANTPTAPTSGRLLYAGDATALNDIDSADTLDLDDIKDAIEIAETFEEATDTTEQINIMEELSAPDFSYIMFVTPRQLKHLQKDSEFQTLQTRTGKDNYYFNAKEAIYLDTLIVSTPYIPKQLGGAGGTTPVDTALFCGANALAFGLAHDPYFKEEDKDYENQKGMAIVTFWGMKKIKFADQEDYGVIAIRSYGA